MIGNPFFWIGMAIFLYTVLLLWPEQAVCLARDRLFKARTKLFEAATQGYHGMSFNDPMYVETRETLNGLIRFSHHFDFITLCLGFFHSRHFKTEKGQKASLFVSVSEDATEDDFKRAHEYNRYIMMGMLSMLWLTIFRQPLLLPFWLIGFIWLLIKSIPETQHSSPSSKIKGGVSDSLAYRLKSS